MHFKWRKQGCSVHTHTEVGAMMCVRLCHGTVADIHGKEWWYDGGSRSESNVEFGIHCETTCEASEVPGAVPSLIACRRGSRSPPANRLQSSHQSSTFSAYNDQRLGEP